MQSQLTSNNSNRMGDCNIDQEMVLDEANTTPVMADPLH